MGKGTIGVLVAGLAMVAGAMSAEAQGGTGFDFTGPSNVTHDQTVATVTGVVYDWTTFSFWVKTKHNGVVKNYSGTRAGSGGCFAWDVCNMSTWGLAAGHTLDFQVKAWVGSTSYTKTHTVIVQQGGSTYVPAKLRPLPGLAVGEEALAWLDRKHTMVMA